jgi:dihydroorotase
LIEGIMAKQFFKKQNRGDITIWGGHIIDPSSGIDIKRGQIVIKDGVIKEISPVSSQIPPQNNSDNFVNAENRIVTAGLIDLHVHLREPGGEVKEDFETGTKAAVAGGFTTICAMPNTDPVPDSLKSILEIKNSIIKKAFCNVLIVGAATIGRDGNKLSDIENLAKEVVAFSDDGKAVENAELIRELLIETKKVSLPFSDHCEVVEISKKAPVHHGNVSEKMGIKGQPYTSETVQLAKGIMLAHETKGHYHAQHLSSKHSIELLKWAKEMGIGVTGEVTVHHLFLTDKALFKHGTNAKCAPPLRDKKDRLALVEALNSGILDAIVTDHAPHTNSEKSLELNDAPFGVIGLETAFSAVYTLVKSGDLSLNRVIEAFTSSPASLFSINNKGRLLPGYDGDVAIFNPSLQWKVKLPFVSKGSNSPFIGMDLSGRMVKTVINGNIIFSADY